MPKKQTAIAIDIDEVLGMQAEVFIQYSNKHFGLNLKLDDYKDEWPDIWGVDLYEAIKRAKKYQTPERLSSILIKDGAERALLKLKENHKLFIVTARPRYTLKATREWLDNNFKGIFSDAHFVPIWEPGYKLTKADICHEIGADYLIDDLAKHCNVAATGGIKAILFGDYSWNRNQAIADGVTRCKDWPAVLRYFEIH